MKKIPVAIVLVALIVVIASSFVACNLFKEIKLDEVKTNLKNAHYNVTVQTGAEYCEGENPYNLTASTLKTYLYASKGDDVIYVFFFTSIDAASFEKDFIMINGMYDGQSNEVVYYATKQARKDAGIG